MSREMSPEAHENMSRAATERWASRTPAELAQISKNMSIAVIKGMTSMTPEAKVSMFNNISKSLNARSEEEKKAWGESISKGGRATNTRKLLELETPNVSKEFGKWFTGFFEGDGSATCLDKVNNMGTGLTFNPEISFTQKDQDVLGYINSVLETGAARDAHRTQGMYPQLRWSGQTKCIPILKLLSQFVVTGASCNRINEALRRVDLPLASVHELSLEWIVGFWDAEGSIYLSTARGGCLLDISQNDRSILDKIQLFLGFGKVTLPPNGCHRLVIRRDEGQVLVDAILKLSHVGRKKNRISEIW